MSRYEEGLQIIRERCGGGKDNLIALATIALTEDPEAKPRPYTRDVESGSRGPFRCTSAKPRPYTRDVDAYYEDGSFYVMTWGESTKIRQIEKNDEVAFTVSGQWFAGNGIGENLGWVMAPKNATLRAKLRKAFAAWYDFANDETKEQCCILAVRITNATVLVDHGAVRYNMDFVKQTAD